MNAFLLITPEAGAVLRQHTAVQENFQLFRNHLQSPQERLDWLHLRHSEQADQSIPSMVDFTWKCFVQHIDSQVVEISESPQFDCLVMHFPADSCGCTARVHSLKTGVHYHWRVVGVDGQGAAVCSEVANFYTESEVPRWIFLEGVSNVRDIGGWATRDGHHVRQGLVYRGGEMNGHMTATVAALRFAEQDLSIRTVLDLRSSTELATLATGGPALSSNVQWVNVNLAAYADIDTAEQREHFAQAFRVLLKPANFPIYTHCWGGADRTGTLIFLVNAALGVTDESLLLDYEMTSLGIWGVRSRESELFQAFMAMLERLAPGQGFQAQAIAYWKSAGITEAELERLRELFLDISHAEQ